MILGLTTATPRSSVALIDAEGTVLGELAHDDEKSHAERIFVMLDALFEQVGVARSEVTLVACDIGPGSFTGVRVGLASAKGIALGLHVPLVGVGSLEAMCSAAFDAAPPSVARCCALLDAKRGETFVGAYDRSGDETLAPRHARIGETAPLIAALDPHTLAFCGSAASREGVAPIVSHPGADFPSAARIAQLGRLRREAVVPLELLEPVYVRAPDAKKMAR